jgi:hypothetical protein
MSYGYTSLFAQLHSGTHVVQLRSMGAVRLASATRRRPLAPHKHSVLLYGGGEHAGDDGADDDVDDEVKGGYDDDRVEGGYDDDGVRGAWL